MIVKARGDLKMFDELDRIWWALGTLLGRL